MAQTLGAIVVKLTSVRSIIDLSKIYFCLSSPTQPLYVRMLSHLSSTTLRNVDASKGARKGARSSLYITQEGRCQLKRFQGTQKSWSPLTGLSFNI